MSNHTYPTTEDELVAFAALMAEQETVVENDRGQVDWEETLDRLEFWANWTQPGLESFDSPLVKRIQKAIRDVRRAAQ